MKKIIFIISILFYNHLFSQEKGIVVGRVLDSNNRNPLQSATVEAFRLSDNDRINFSVSNSNGWFHLLNIPLYDSVVIQISFTGYESFRDIVVLEEKQFTMNTVLLHAANKQMDTILIKARPPLMVIKKDTIEFTAAIFKTLPNAMAQDLLKKIPGLIIDDEGHLVFNGHAVNKILVDGKVFFNSDGRVALNNIPVDLIKKVQISVDDPPLNETGNNLVNQKTHTLNIRLKEGSKFFGNAKAARGTENRYDFSGLINRTREKEQLIWLAGWNNINKMDAMPSNISSVSAMMNGGGITRSLTSGLNYTRDYNNGTALRGVYEYARPVTILESVQERQQNILPDSSLFDVTQRQIEKTCNGHAVTMNLQKKSFYFNTSIFGLSLANKFNTHSTTTSDRGLLLNNLQNNYMAQGRQSRWETNMSFTRSFNNKDRSVWLQIGYGMQWHYDKDRNDAIMEFYKNNSIDSLSITRQLIERNDKNNFFYANVQYIEPLSKRLQWKLANNLILQQNKVNKTTWQLDGNGNKHNIDSLYSNSFVSSVLTNNVISGFIYEGKLLTTKIGLGLQLNSLYNNNRTHAEIMRNKQIRLVPEIEMAIGKKLEKENLTLNVRSHTDNPTREQLQPVADNTNLLYIKMGNPNLRSSVEYNIGLSYFKLLSLSSGSAFSVNWTYSQIANKIIPFVQYDSLGRQISWFVNINGIWSSNFTVSSNKLFKNDSHVFSIGTSSTVHFMHDRFYLNGLLSDVNIIYLLPTLHFRYTHENRIEVAIHYTPSYGRVKYEFNPMQNQKYWLQNITGSLDLYAFKRLTWKNNFSYRYNTSYSANFDKSSLLWNIELAWLCFKNKKGEIRFTSFDMLKQNRNISRIVAENYIENSESNNLQQFFMIGFYWQFSKLNQKKLPN